MPLKSGFEFLTLSLENKDPRGGQCKSKVLGDGGGQSSKFLSRLMTIFLQMAILRNMF